MLSPNVIDPKLFGTLFGGQALIRVRSFDNELSLIAEVFSVDGNGIITFILDTHKLNIIATDLLSSIPEENIKRNSDDKGIIIKSGIYQLSTKLIEHISSQLRSN